jgi:hypothetical protein
MSLSFTKRLREPIRHGEITTTVRIWKNLRVKVGGLYGVEGGGHVRVTRIQHVDRSDITEEIARASGFADLADLMGVAQHGYGQQVFLIDFVYEGPEP